MFDLPPFSCASRVRPGRLAALRFSGQNVLAARVLDMSRRPPGRRGSFT